MSLYIRVKNPIATRAVASSVVIRCSNCDTPYFFTRRLGQSLGADCPDACPNCKKLFPTIDYLISESNFMDPSGIFIKYSSSDI